MLTAIWMSHIFKTGLFHHMRPTCGNSCIFAAGRSKAFPHPRFQFILAATQRYRTRRGFHNKWYSGKIARWHCFSEHIIPAALNIRRSL